MNDNALVLLFRVSNFEKNQISSKTIKLIDSKGLAL